MTKDLLSLSVIWNLFILLTLHGFFYKTVAEYGWDNNLLLCGLALLVIDAVFVGGVVLYYKNRKAKSKIAG